MESIGPPGRKTESLGSEWRPEENPGGWKDPGKVAVAALTYYSVTKAGKAGSMYHATLPKQANNPSPLAIIHLIFCLQISEAVKISYLLSINTIIRKPGSG
jgi:hypothetical protein